MNHWLKKHIHKRQSQVDVQDNYKPIKLNWHEECYDEMPILRDNYLELQGFWNIHVTEIELEMKRNERYDWINS